MSYLVDLERKSRNFAVEPGDRVKLIDNKEMECFPKIPVGTLGTVISVFGHHEISIKVLFDGYKANDSVCNIGFYAARYEIVERKSDKKKVYYVIEQGEGEIFPDLKAAEEAAKRYSKLYNNKYFIVERKATVTPKLVTEVDVVYDD